MTVDANAAPAVQAPAAEAPAANPAPANPAPAADPAKPADPATPAAGDQANPDPVTTEFKVPDAYKDKGYLKNVKSEEDVYKMLDSAQEMIGQKSIVPDLNKATPEEREEFYSKMRPADAREYAFDDEATTPELKSAFSDMFMKNGISKAQGDALIAQYNALETAQYEQLFGPDGMVNEFKTSFGDNYETTVKSTSKLLRQILSPADIKMIEGDKVNNAYMGLVHRVAKAVQDKFGVKETASQVDDQPAAPAVDLDKTRAELRAKIKAEDGNPFAKPETKQSLIDQLQATYSQPKRK